MFCSVLALNAQEKQQLTGKIKADSIEAPVHIINITQEKGSVSDKAGNFKIEVAENDLLLISSVQFQRKEIKITSKILNEEILNIELRPALTELEQVRVHNLSGNLEEDIANIKVIDMPVISVPPSPPSVIPRGTPNAAFNASQTQAPAGGNILGLVGLIAGKPNFGSLGGKSASPATSEREIVKNLRIRFDDYFFTNHLKIDSTHIMNFLTYIFENGFHKNLLKEERALELVVFLEKKSTVYLKLIAE
ncbi:CarboxypepD_reg-like domain-containing protein [Salegentibacter salegens]|uniref:CarboxypepD_reg-like domain-containing protein n=2 Tax=Salegentibacter salegens TaxID=143223 RepID=A0A1M7NST7_9FLAO|nr:carboxypeptidase-like regulatory domain-containing protein [Salegentibacter salegens]PRX45829.1 carboxypeptidase-like protein [Salegentibacter salegens]SHN07088.1 CarboxypepD_reg-like domain-containing protein [Salegentibacter salegens]